MPIQPLKISPTWRSRGNHSSLFCSSPTDGWICLTAGARGRCLAGDEFVAEKAVRPLVFLRCSLAAGVPLRTMAARRGSFSYRNCVILCSGFSFENSSSFFFLCSLLSMADEDGRWWRRGGTSSSILMWIHRILCLPIQQRRFSRLGSSLPVGFFGGRRAGLGTWSVSRSDEVVLELHLVGRGLR